MIKGDKMKKKIMVDVPNELWEKLDKTAKKQMITKSSIIKLVVNQYCDRVLEEQSNERPVEKKRGFFGL